MKPISEAVTEGLIHNLRTPLNLVLGYAQKIRDENGFSGRIYEAGIKMDDMLQQTWEALQIRISGKSPTELNEWLQNELVILHCVLPVKHHFIINAGFLNSPVRVDASPRELSERLENLLFELLPASGMKEISVKVDSEGLFLLHEEKLFRIWPENNDA